ncbi:zinc finger protein [Besnoitia besnoiti]|uniref:Zinc finger protein n=1 Tax=Besnoitia besnoiti TaxID=94643 RepID=A0A2A9MAA0_BESBE|nr:zinc finger protein [Besnoitia besnoiti]PFH32613.1 zinc finger protein [Besnoitia besnoiti]
MSGLEKSGFGIAHDFTGRTQEQTDFPILCETCLGDNPYVRMQRNREGKECRVCTRPYTAFRWKPGPKARYKSTVICQTCAKLKNVCQTCVFDLQYGLPVQVRDKILEGAKVDLPDHPLNRDYMASRLEKAADQLPYGKLEEPEARLRALARTHPYYRRNAPRVCTFWQRGECRRGDECPYLHQEVNHDPSLANQNLRDRYTGQDDPVAEKVLRQAASKPNAESVTPPADTSITTVFVGGLTKEITEQDLRDSFYAFGELLSIKMYRGQQFAFLCYAERSSAEEAVKQMHANLMIKGVKLRVAWAKPQDKRKKPEDNSASAAQEDPGLNVIPPPLPGLPSIQAPVPLPFLPNASSGDRGTPGARPAGVATGVLPPASMYGAGGATAMYASMNPAEAEYMKR